MKARKNSVSNISPGFSLHAELELLVKAGLSPLEALQTTTRNPAEFMGMGDCLGTIEKGKITDLVVLLDAAPLADIRNTQKISSFVKGGKYFDRAVLEGFLSGAERDNRQN